MNTSILTCGLEACLAGGPPVCSRCGSHELAFLSEDLRRTWAAERGVQWDYKGGLGYWRLCQACHRKVRAALHTIFWATLFCSVPFCSVRFCSAVLCCAGLLLLALARLCGLAPAR